MTDVRLSLVDGFDLTCDSAHVPVQRNSQRVIAYLALRERPLLRVHVAGALWTDCSEERAYGNLRSALWRLRGHARDAIGSDAGRVWLAAHVRVDVREVVAMAHGILREADGGAEADVERSLLAGDLLPDWYDDWVLLERERLRELRVHALERLAARDTRDGRFGRAIDTALTAIQADPLRESAHRVLIGAYLAEGNASAGVRQYREYCRRAGEELGIEPSAQLRQMVSDVAR